MCPNFNTVTYHCHLSLHSSCLRNEATEFFRFMIFVLGGNQQYTAIQQVGASQVVGHMDLLMNIPESSLEFFWFSFVSFLNCPLLWHHPLLYLLKELIYPHGQKYQYFSNGSDYLHSHFFALEFQAHHRITQESYVPHVYTEQAYFLPPTYHLQWHQLSHSLSVPSIIRHHHFSFK